MEDLPGEQGEVLDLVRQCQDKLAGIAGLDRVPVPWLHMTTQIVGFADEISDAEIAGMVAGAVRRLAKIAPVEVELGSIWFHSEAVMLGIRPPRALHPVREAIRASVAEALDVHQLTDAPDWTPHISVAYSHQDGPAAPVINALAMPPEPRLVERGRGASGRADQRRPVVSVGPAHGGQTGYLSRAREINGTLDVGFSLVTAEIMMVWTLAGIWGPKRSAGHRAGLPLA